MSTLRTTAESFLIRKLLRQADRLTRAGHTLEAGRLLDQAWQSSRDAWADPCRASCCRRLAVLHRLTGSRDCAAQFQQLALTAELQLQGRPSGVSLWIAACEARERGGYEDAEQLLDASVVSSPAARPADVLAERGRLCRAQGDCARAITLLQRSARLLMRENDRFNAARVLEELGGVGLEDQRYRMAAKALNRAARLFQRMDCGEDARRSLSSAREADSRRRVLQAAAKRN